MKEIVDDIANDVDADGYSDLVVAAPLADDGGDADVGVVYLIRGGSTLPDGDVASASSAVIWGEEPSGAFGLSLDVSDLEDDGSGDIVVSEYDSAVFSVSEVWL